MGLIGWFKHKFNIGGVKLSIVEVDTITSEEGWIKGKIALSTKEPVIGQLTYKLLCETTKGSGTEQKTSTSTISEMTVIVGIALNENESKVEDFTFEYSLKNWFEKQGGVLGAASKAFSFIKNTAGDKGFERYYVEISATLPGVWSNPSAKCPVTVAVAR
jgi:hypothetical protein